MPEATQGALLLAAAVIAAWAGLGWLALARDTHWEQACGGPPARPGTRRMLRVLGGASLALSLGLCLGADHPTMAALVWVMSIAGAALAIAFTLAWRPAAMALLVLRRRRPSPP